MNFLRRCVGGATAPLSLSSRTFLPTVTQSSPYSTNLLHPEHPSSSIRSPEVNEQAKQPMAHSSRPREIPYQVKAANLVKFIGHIKLPVKFQSFRDGKHYAATLISDAYKPIDKACLIPVLFVGDLAYVVSCHVKENDYVYVTGKLSWDPFPFLLQENQMRLHILAQDINFVEGFDEKAYDYSRKKEIVDNVKNSISKTNSQNLWRDLMKNPNEWLSFADYKSKGLVSPKYPDFKHTENAASLWLDRAPEWFLVRIENLDLHSHCNEEEMWKSLAENPNQWVSYADDKSKGLVSPKYPDFKHTENAASLWLDRAPEWFLARIESLDLHSHCNIENMWKSLAENPNQWVSFVDDKSKGLVPPKFPDFKHTENAASLWLSRAPEWFLARIESLDLHSHCSIENMWKSLAENPNQWVSFVDDKSKGLAPPKYPDFKRTENSASLWLGCAPVWFLARIENLDLDTHCSKEKIWKSLAENPDEWWDCRADKRTEKIPDFKHKKSGIWLWIRDSPEWFVAMDIGKLKDTKAEAWKSLVENPSLWWDNRLENKFAISHNVYLNIYKIKHNFKHRYSGERLWLESAPDWVMSKLPPLNQNQKVGGV